MHDENELVGDKRRHSRRSLARPMSFRRQTSEGAGPHGDQSRREERKSALQAGAAAVYCGLVPHAGTPDLDVRLCPIPAACPRLTQRCRRGGHGVE